VKHVLYRARHFYKSVAFREILPAHGALGFVKRRHVARAQRHDTFVQGVHRGSGCLLSRRRAVGHDLVDIGMRIIGQLYAYSVLGERSGVLFHLISDFVAAAASVVCVFDQTTNRLNRFRDWF
jgi:hypothetical protein|tara:strand:+ start:1485 stop:1853 length:369 start_codon:yes stop_codon:yes gene_type:complete